MRHLLAKDVRLVAPYLWLIVPAHVLWCAQAFLAPSLYFWMSLAAACGWTIGPLMIEWHFDADRLLGSLPVTRAAIVKARYASALGALVLGAALYVFYGDLITAVATERLIGRWHGMRGWASVDGVTAFLAVGYLLVVSFLPFCFRFGFALGGGLFSAAAIITVSGATGLARLLGDGGGVVGSPGAVAAGRSSHEVIRGWLSSFFATWGLAPALVALLVGALVLGVLSARLSIRFYEGRDL